MYTALLLLLMGVAFALFVTGLRRGRRGRMINGLLLGVESEANADKAMED